MTTPAPTCPTCQAPATDTSTTRHCKHQGCTWLTCRCGTRYSAIHPTTDHYSA